MKKKNQIKRSDYNRILITETLPYETPIIFSNDGLYDKVTNLATADDIEKTLLKGIVFGEGLHRPIHSTIPYLYKIKKNSIDFRRLALLHPMSQWQVKIFYQKYERLILHYCAHSPASIRAPSKIASSFYSKSSWENVNQYKSGNVTTSSADRYAKHTPSYFSYRGHDRLYKFFNSREYFTLEKRFSTLLTLDVSKCFDSIYTHCLSWAVKDKEFTKQNVGVLSTFGQEFDTAIRHGNHGETNGIPIGPEVSRIFSEILFQEIDRRTISKLTKLRFDIDYSFRRYVDDVFIFSKDDSTARLVYNVYADSLVAFNLHANTAKSLLFNRPFFTTKSRLVFEASRNANDFFDKFLIENGRSSLTPAKVFSPWRLTKNYIDSIKALCSHSSVNYDEIASFLISVIAERIKKLANNDLSSDGAELRLDYVQAIDILLDVLFFLYSVAPSVSASYKLSTSLILAFRFSRDHMPEHVATVSQKIYDLTSTLLNDQCGRSHGEGVEGFIHLECLNVVLATRELGVHYLLPESILSDLFIEDRDLTYFTIVSCLFYIKDEPQYINIRAKIINSVLSKLGDLSDVFMSCEKAYLLLDMLSCPFIQNTTKANWVKAVHKILKKPPPSAASLHTFVAGANKGHWQVDWSDVDLLNSLEKKELKQAY